MAFVVEAAEAFDTSDLVSSEDTEKAAAIEDTKDEVEKAYVNLVEPTDGVGDDLLEALDTADVVEKAVASKAEETVEAVEETETETETATTGAQKRIQKLVSQRNELKDELQAQRQSFEQQMYIMQRQLTEQATQQKALFEQQVALERNRIEQETRRREAEYEREQYERMSALDRHTYDTVKRAKSETAAELQHMFDEKLTPYQKALEEERQARISLQQEAEAKERRSKLFSMTQDALEGTVLAEFDSDTKKALKKDMEEMLLTYSAAFSEYPEQSASKFKKFLDAYARGYIKTKAAATKKPAQVAGKKVPATPTRKTAAVADSLGYPTWDEMKRMGFDNYVQYEASKFKRRS